MDDDSSSSSTPALLSFSSEGLGRRIAIRIAWPALAEFRREAEMQPSQFYTGEPALRSFPPAPMISSKPAAPPNPALSCVRALSSLLQNGASYERKRATNARWAALCAPSLPYSAPQSAERGSHTRSIVPRPGDWFLGSLRAQTRLVCQSPHGRVPLSATATRQPVRAGVVARRFECANPAGRA